MYAHNIVYRTLHAPTGRYYIGVHSTNNLRDGYCGSGIVITNLLKAHPKTEFEVKIIADLPTRSEALDLEAMIVQPFLVDKKLFPLVLNLVAGGSGYARPPNVGLSTRQKMSAAKKGKPGNNKGKKFSEQACKNMGDAQRGKKQTQEHKDKVSASLKGKPKPPRTAEHAAKIAAAHTGRKDSESSREAKRMAQLRRWTKVRGEQQVASSK